MNTFSRMNNDLINARRELNRVNAALEEKERFLAKVLDLSPFVVYVYDLGQGRNVYSSRELTTLLGFGPEEITAMGEPFFLKLLHPEDLERFGKHKAVLAGMDDSRFVDFEYRVRDRAGIWRWLRSTETVFEREPGGRPKRTVGIVRDITVDRHREELLKDASRIDELTGLRNRKGFRELAEHHLRLAERRRSGFAIVFLDLDCFKAINDRYGHAEGDEALKTAARLLEGCLRSGDILARYGGDEFICLLSDAFEPSIQPLLSRIRDSTDALNLGSGKPWRLEFSFGTALSDPERPESLDELVDRADRLMYEDKRERNPG
ncbi:MAG: hypothetical protein CVV51_07665 [Spirochaetae bacterium HGW-Spirochaetae-7]|nr:MAG: hypothetical protein CVV51_07665 [Spirochaetae bacterium HGW-Spirochaetae-7]